MKHNAAIVHRDGTVTYKNVEIPEDTGIETPKAPLFTEKELIQQEITDLQLSDIEQGQEITELFLTQLGG